MWAKIAAQKPETKSPVLVPNVRWYQFQDIIDWDDLDENDNEAVHLQTQQLDACSKDHEVLCAKTDFERDYYWSCRRAYRVLYNPTMLTFQILLTNLIFAGLGDVGWRCAFEDVLKPPKQCLYTSWSFTLLEVHSSNWRRRVLVQGKKRDAAAPAEFITAMMSSMNQAITTKARSEWAARSPLRSVLHSQPLVVLVGEYLI